MSTCFIKKCFKGKKKRKPGNMLFNNKYRLICHISGLSFCLLNKYLEKYEWICKGKTLKQNGNINDVGNLNSISNYKTVRYGNIDLVSAQI